MQETEYLDTCMFSGGVLHPRLAIASKCVPGVEGLSAVCARFSTDLVFPGPCLGVKKKGYIAR